MITSEDLYILSEDEYKREENQFLIQEKDKNNKFLMNLEVDINDNNFYKVFIKKGKSEKDEDHCKLRFLRHLNFPDGIYLEIHEESITCHVFELKRTPIPKLKKISMQFITAKFHLVSLLSILNIDMKKVKFLYYVGYINDLSLQDKFNLGLTRKVIPGRPVAVPKNIADWIENRIEIQVGTQIFQENILKVQMNLNEEVENGYQIYQKEIAIM